MGNKEQILEYRQRLDKTLASNELSSEEAIKCRLKNELLHSSPSENQEYVESIVNKNGKHFSSCLDMLRSVGDDSSMTATHDQGHGEWKLKQDTDEYRVMYREGPQGTPLHSLLVEGFVDGPMDVCLCLAWEIALFHRWWPQFNFPTFKIIESKCVQKVRIGEQIALDIDFFVNYLEERMKCAWPLSAREVVVHYFEVEILEDDLIIVVLNSVTDTESVDRSTHGFTNDGIPEVKDIVRAELVGAFALQKVTSDRSYFRTIMTMDIKLDFVPPSLINFMSRQLVGSGFKLYKKVGFRFCDYANQVKYLSVIVPNCFPIITFLLAKSTFFQAVASVAKGDEDFGKVLKDTLYVRIREGLNQERRLKMDSQSDTITVEKSADKCHEEHGTETFPADATVTGKTSLGDHLIIRSKQADMSGSGQTSQYEIEEEEIEQHTKSEEDGNGIISIDQSSSHLTVEQISKEKKVFISPEVEHALDILNNVISMVRGSGINIQTWSGLGSSNQEVVNSRVAPQDCTGGEIFAEAVKTDKKDATVDGAETGSRVASYRPHTPESLVKEVYPYRTAPTTPEQNLLVLEKTHDGVLNSSRGRTLGESLRAPVLENMSKDYSEVIVKVNGTHEARNINGREKSRQKKHMFCCFNSTADQ
ncbi:hypothetical protein C5167_046975 [Papaver somniferum]|uniref:START domain-containing protein n=1 Tax=Papaver somniferum TaxID=3469 RepID=A0A4Y7LI50_PAPSO|nr:hypothetical protein C5167_046975 [Papaver somniferum]